MNKVKVKKKSWIIIFVSALVLENIIAQKLGSHKMEKPSSQKATENTQTLLYLQYYRILCNYHNLI